MVRLTLSGWLVLLSWAVCGCGGGATNSSKSFSYDADAITAKAFQALDKNNDGQIDSAELSPSLKSALAALDTNRDKKVSKDELNARIGEYAKRPTPVLASATIQKGGKPFGQSTVELRPEPWMGLNPVVGTTDERGYVEFKETGSGLNGIAPGFYTVTIGATTLGCEVYEDPRSGMPMLTWTVP